MKISTGTLPCLLGVAVPWGGKRPMRRGWRGGCSEAVSVPSVHQRRQPGAAAGQPRAPLLVHAHPAGPRHRPGAALPALQGHLPPRPHLQGRGHPAALASLFLEVCPRCDGVLPVPPPELPGALRGQRLHGCGGRLWLGREDPHLQVRGACPSVRPRLRSKGIQLAGKGGILGSSWKGRDGGGGDIWGWIWGWRRV